MIGVTFYKFSKKENSTARPAASSGTSYDCILKVGSNVVTPTIQLDLGMQSFPDFNYCYIPSFGRYYYVSDWRSDNALWTASLTTDVLATYKTQIGASSLYVLRSSAAYDGDIVDTLYPAATDSTLSQSFFNLEYTGTHGVVSIGIVNKQPNYGALTYYVMAPDAFGATLSQLLDNKFLEKIGFLPAEMSLAIQKSIADPIQHVKSCVYLPYTYGSLSGNIDTKGIVIYDWPIMNFDANEPTPYTAGYVQTGRSTHTYSVSVTVPKHPQAASRGGYLNVSPYASYTLFCPPFGAIELDSTKLAGSSNLNLIIKTDLLNGLGILIVEDENYKEINRIEGQIGVPLNMSQVTRDFLGAAQNLANSAIGLGANAITGNVPGIIMSAISGVGSVINALRPQCQSIGAGGSFVQLESGRGSLVGQFLPVAPEDNSHNGRPLCQVRQVSALGGYMLVQHGDVAIPGTKGEIQQVRSYLEGGFYYE